MSPPEDRHVLEVVVRAPKCIQTKHINANTHDDYGHFMILDDYLSPDIDLDAFPTCAESFYVRSSSPRSTPPPLPAEGGAHRRRSEPATPPHSKSQPSQSLPSPALRLSTMTAAADRPKAQDGNSAAAASSFAHRLCVDAAAEPSSAVRGRGTALRPLAPPTELSKRDTPQQRDKSLPRPLGTSLFGPAAHRLATAADEAAAAPRAAPATGAKLVPRSLRPRPGISEAPSTPRTPHTPRGGVTVVAASASASTDRGAKGAKGLSATVALRRGISSHSVRPGMELNI